MTTNNLFTSTIANANFSPCSIFTKSGNIATPPKDYYGNVQKDNIGTLAEAGIAEKINADLKLDTPLLPCNEGLDATWCALTTEQLVRLGTISSIGERHIQVDLGIDILIMPREWVTSKKGKMNINDINAIRTVQVKYQPNCPSYTTANIETHKFVDEVRVDTGINCSIATWHAWAINGYCNIMMKTDELKDLTLNKAWPERVTAAHKAGDKKKSTFTRRVDLIEMLDLPSAFTLEMMPEFSEYFNKAHSTREGVTCMSVSSIYYTQPWNEFALRLFLTSGHNGIDAYNADQKFKKDHIKVYGNPSNI